MKAILVIDVPDNYGNGDWYIVGDDLKIVYDDYGSLKLYKNIDDDMAQLKPMPKRKLIDIKKDFYIPLEQYDDYIRNKLIDEILGEEE